MYERFTDRARKVMQLANQEARRFNHEYIGTEHILLGLIAEGSGVAANVLKNLDIDLRKIRLEVEKIVQSGPDMVTMGKLPQTPRAKKVIEYTIEEARNLKHNYVGTEHLLLGLIREEEGVASQVLMNLGLKLEDVREEVLNLLGHNRTTEESGGAGSGEQQASKGKSKTPALDAFGRDLTELARQGKLDPVVGRGDEIERVLQVLGRRTRNNPLLFGEPGVGKTAVVAGLAQRLAADSGCRGTPYRRLVAIHFSWYAAGAENYERFRGLIQALVEEVRRAKDVLLFLDDLQKDDFPPYALAPLTAALNRGTIQCMAASSGPREPNARPLSELPSCFAVVRIEPLSKPATLPVLAALRGRYAEHHRVQITDEAIAAVVELCDRIADGRRLPGIAVDVLDEACARARLRVAASAPDLRPFDLQIEELNRAKEEAVAEMIFEEAVQIRDQADKIKHERDRVAQEWEEKSAQGIGVVDAAVVAEAVRLMSGPTEPF